MAFSKTIISVFFVMRSFSLAKSEWLDMTRSFENGMLALGQQFRHTLTFEGPLKNDIRDIPYIINYNLSFGEHTGTHMDAPSHFSQGMYTIEQIPIENLVGEAIVVDVSSKAAKDRTYNFTIGDLKCWERIYGRIPHGSIVFILFGWGKFYGNNEKYLGTSILNPKCFRFPGVGGSATKWLAKFRNIKGIAVDTFTVDSPQSLTFPTHQTLADNNLYGIEQVANIEKLPAKGATVFVFPMKIKNGSGAPVRILAKLPWIGYFNAVSMKKRLHGNVHCA